jgi:hypothetical protein
MKPCKICKTKFKPTSLKHVCCSYDCAIEHAKVLSIISAKKSQQRAEKQRKQANKQTRENLKSLGDYKKELQILVNRIARKIDYGQPCISSGREWKPTDQGGHYYGSQAWSEIRFNLWNIHSQSVSDNMYKSGNPIGFRQGLTDRYGVEIMALIDDLKVIYKGLVWDKQMLIEAIYKAKQLEKIIEEKKRTPEELISERLAANLFIGIYI